jgi:hypothetical protein
MYSASNVMPKVPSIVEATQHADTEICVPLAAISRFEKVERQNSHFMFGGENCYALDIYAKDFR